MESLTSLGLFFHGERDAASKEEISRKVSKIQSTSGHPLTQRFS